MGYPPIERENTDHGIGMQIISNYTIPVSGNLTRWKVYLSVTNLFGFIDFFNKPSTRLLLQVWRELEQDSLVYTRVGHTRMTSLSDGYNEIEALIAVKQGDVIGWYLYSSEPWLHAL